MYTIEEGTGGALVPLSKDLKTPALYLNQNAHRQLLQKLDFDKRTFDHMSDVPKLPVLNLNHFIQNVRGDREVCLRMQDGNMVRAVVSPDYQPFDRLDLVSILEPFTDDAVVRWHSDDDLNFHLSVSFPKTATEIRVGDVVEHGIHVAVSEVGLRSAQVAGFLYRLRCSNGMIGGGDGGFFRFRHTGDGDRMRDAVKAAIATVKMESEKITAQFKLSLGVAVNDPAGMLAKVVKEKNLTQEQFKASLNALLGDSDAHTLFGVSNALSGAAHNFEGEKSFELQRASVDVLALPGNYGSAQN
jgi:hypothetical protein